MKYINLDTWERTKHYQLFKTYSNPYFSVCANLDITAFMEHIRKNNLPFFASFLYFVMKVVNGIPEFKTRIRPDGVVEHDVVHPSYTVMTDESLFRFVTTPFIDDFVQFVRNVQEDVNAQKKVVDLADENRDDLIYISSLKWVSFTSVTHPTDEKNPDSFPRITWGKYFTDNEKILIPFSVMAHHSLCDGLHAGLIYLRLQAEINKLTDEKRG